MIADQKIVKNTVSRLTPLVKSFIAVILIYQAVQFAIFCGYSLRFGFFSVYILPFTLISLLFHALTLVVLYLFQADFVIEPSGVRLDRINKANKITLFRVSTLPTILFVILASKDYPMRYELVVLVAIVFVTDFFDGYVSRRDKETTRVGKMMDSASDYSLLFVITIVFYYFHIIPKWFFGLLVARLVGQVAMVLVVLAVKKKITPKTSFFGKATVASTMILYGIELLRFVADIPRSAYATLEIIVGVIVAIAIVDKIIIMAKALIAPAPGTPESGRLNSITYGENNGDDKERARDSSRAD